MLISPSHYVFLLIGHKVEKIEDSFDVINSRPKPLAVYVFTNNEQLKKGFVENISSGGMLINDTVLHVTDSSPLCIHTYIIFAFLHLHKLK